MNLNTQRLQYLLEIEKTRSISQAAANLYMAQPNLSRILRETEEQLGFKIFDRTRNGVAPTAVGNQFLLRAQSILQDTLFIEQLANCDRSDPNLRFCIPHSYHLMSHFCDYLTDQNYELHHDISIEECGPITAIDRLESGHADIILIRYLPNYRSYFRQRALEKNLTMIDLPDISQKILLHREGPLASYDSITSEQLTGLTCILCKTQTLTAQSYAREHRIITNDRLAQFQLLESLPDSFAWSEPLPQTILDRFHLVQRSGSTENRVYHTALLYREKAHISAEYQHIIQLIQSYCITVK